MMLRRAYLACAPFTIALLLIHGAFFKPDDRSFSAAVNGSRVRTQAALSINGPALLTQHNDTSRTGANLNETVLNTSNVNAAGFGKIFSRTVDGEIYAQPLYVPGVAIPGAGTHNVVYVATEHDSVYAFDADNPEAQTPLWQVSLGASVPSTDIAKGYHDLVPEVGITSTPVIDPNTGILYVVAKTKDDAGAYHQTLHALDVTSGSEEANSPVEIAATFEGTGDDNVDGLITFNPLLQLNRPGLLLANGMVYIAFGSHGDINPYHGWIMAYDAATLQQTAVYVTTPDGGRGAVWQSGQGLIADANGNIYALVGNGTCDAMTDCGRNLGESFIKLTPSLVVTDWFTPQNRGTLDKKDLDVGSGGGVLLPGENLIVGGGKDGLLRVVDTDLMGRFNPNSDRDIQEFQASPNQFLTSPVYWNSPPGGPRIYIWAAGDMLKSYSFAGGVFLTTPADKGSIQAVGGGASCPPLTLSANGNQSGSGIVWASCALPTTKGVPASGVLRAFDASDLSNELWDSTQMQSRDDPGLFAKFCPPTVANGKVYMASFSSVLNVYGLIKSDCTATLSTNAQEVSNAGGSESVTVTSAAGCLWDASSDSDFISVVAGAEFSGTGVQGYLVSPNPGPARSGTITILDQQLVVSQDSGCAFSITPAKQKFTADGGTGTAMITASENDCDWTVSTPAKWIQFSSGGTGTGSGPVSFTIAPNHGASRVARISIAGKKALTISQGGG